MTADLTGLMHAVNRVRSNLKASQSQTSPKPPAFGSITAEGIGAGSGSVNHSREIPHDPPENRHEPWNCNWCYSGIWTFLDFTKRRD